MAAAVVAGRHPVGVLDERDERIAGIGHADPVGVLELAVQLQDQAVGRDVDAGLREAMASAARIISSSWVLRAGARESSALDRRGGRL